MTTREADIFTTTLIPGPRAGAALARRPILARALRSDITTPQHGAVFVWGEPLIGKTTLVRHVLWSLEPDRFLVARIPIGVLAEDVTGRRRFASLLGDQVRRQVPAERKEVTGILESKSFPEAIEYCLATAIRTDRQLVLAVEGMERFELSAQPVWPKDVKANLKHLLNMVPSLGLLLTSRAPVGRLEHTPLASEMRTHFVPPLDDDVADRFLGSHLRNVTIDDDAMMLFNAAAGGRPYLLQIIGRNCERLGSSGVSEIGLNEAGEILHACWAASEHLFRPLLASLDDLDQVLLAAVAYATAAIDTPAASLESVHREARRLGFEGELELLLMRLGMLRVRRLIENTESNAFYHCSSWFADYLRAGIFA
ncbi:MAG: ATP-binding protein [Myxococcales bacterium]|nr:ATP-binding protein [Myxococcales bacterium]